MAIIKLMIHMVYYNIWEKNLIKMIKEAKEDYKNIVIEENKEHKDSWNIYGKFK